MQRDDWLLCVDESGDFGDVNGPNGCAIVVGLLVRSVDGAALRRVWRSRVEAALAPIPWPPHAADLRQDAWLAAASEVWGGSEGAAASLRSAGAPAAHYLAQREAESWNTLCSALRRGESFRFAEVLRLGRRLRASEVPLGGLQGWRDAARRRLGGFLDEVVAQAGGAAHLLVCEAGASKPTRIGAWKRDAYVDALGVMVERAWVLLQSHHTQRPVMSVVATRRVQHHVFGKTPIRGHDLSELQRAVCDGLPGAPSVRFDFPGPPHHYNAAVHPGVVLADLLALRARWEFERARGRSLHDLRRRLQARGALGGKDHPIATAFTPTWRRASTLARIDPPLLTKKDPRPAARSVT